MYETYAAQSSLIHLELDYLAPSIILQFLKVVKFQDVAYLII